MTQSLLPGQKGEPLPADSVVFRLAPMPPSGYGDFTNEVDAIIFKPSSADERSSLQSLSVWAEGLTTPQQARELRDASESSQLLALFLSVDDIRLARPTPDSPDVPYLDVVWEPLLVAQGGEMVPDDRPGAEGHAGITGLVRLRTGVANAKSLYKSLREELVRRVRRIEVVG